MVECDWVGGSVGEWWIVDLRGRIQVGEHLVDFSTYVLHVFSFLISGQLRVGRSDRRDPTYDNFNFFVGVPWKVELIIATFFGL